MTTTISRLYESFSVAKKVVEDLQAAGLPHSEISLVASNADNWHRTDAASSGTVSGKVDRDADRADDRGEGAGAGAGIGAAIGGGAGLLAGLGMLAIPGIGPVVAAGWLVAMATGAAAGGAAGGIIGALTQSGATKEEAEVYAEGMRRGGTLVTARVPDADRARYETIMNRSAIDIQKRGAAYREAGWRSFDSSAKPYTAEQSRKERDLYSSTKMAGTASGAMAAGKSTRDKQTIPVVEEQLQVGKRKVEQGAVRVHTHVTETPVEQTVNLREERVIVERRPVDRSATSADLNKASQDREFEVRTTLEEPVVSKTARVVEEVEIGRQTTEHQETVRDTVRRTDVDVENVDDSLAPTVSTRKGSLPRPRA